MAVYFITVPMTAVCPRFPDDEMPPSPSCRTRRAATCALLVAMGGGSIHAQEAIPRVGIDLGGGAIKSVLPFDEPFLLLAKASPEIVEVTATYRLGCLKNGRMCESTEEWTPLKAWSRRAGVFASDSMFFSVERLVANRSYEFAFTIKSKLSETDAGSFRSSVAKRLDTFLAARPVGEDLDDKEIRTLQSALVALIPRSAGRTIEVAAGSIFDPVSPTSNLLATLNLAHILDSQDERASTISNLNGAVTDATARLAQVHESPALLKLATAGSLTELAEFSKRNASGFEAIQVVRKTGTDEMGEIVDGRRALAADAPRYARERPWDSAWTASALATRVERLARTQLTLGALSDVVIAASLNPAARTRANLTDEEIRNALTLIDATQSELVRVQHGVDVLRDALAARRALIEASADDVVTFAVADAFLLATTTANFDTRTKAYVSADIGIVSMPRIGETVPYAGANFYCGPVNKRVPLSVLKGFCRRTALTVGVTLASIARTGTRDNAIGQQSLMFGVGWRATDAVRVGAGVLVFKSIAHNPLQDRSLPAATPYLSISLDWDARSALGKFGDVFFK